MGTLKKEYVLLVVFVGKRKFCFLVNLIGQTSVNKTEVNKLNKYNHNIASGQKDDSNMS